MNKVVQYWDAFISQITAHPLWAGIAICVLLALGVWFMLT